MTVDTGSRPIINSLQSTPQKPPKIFIATLVYLSVRFVVIVSLLEVHHLSLNLNYFEPLEMNLSCLWKVISDQCLSSRYDLHRVGVTSD